MMGSDGASYGVPASRALKTIIGGDPQPTDDELESVEEMRTRILSTPIRDTWVDGMEFGTPESEKAYEDACYAVAHAMLNLMLSDPSTAELEEDSFWAALKAQYDDDSEERKLLSGLSGFQVGWATNAARRCVELEPRPNPAIVTIELETNNGTNMS